MNTVRTRTGRILTRLSRLLPGAAVAWLALAGMTANGAELPGYSRHDFSLPAETGRFILIDGNEDGLSDILTVAGQRIDVFFQHPETGFDFSEPGASLALPGRSTAWDLSRNYPGPGPDASAPLSVIALIDGSRVSRWQLREQGFSGEQEMLDGVDSFLGRGNYRMNFSRDLNDNGRDDLIIPGHGELSVRIRNADGSYQRPLPVRSSIRVDNTLHTGREIDSRVGQSVTIPAMQLRDVNADNAPDLIVDTEQSLDVFLANTTDGAGYFPGNPSFSVDRAAIEERLGGFDVDRLDFSNLTGALALTHEEILRDINGDGIEDMILREGGRVAVHLGGPDGVDLSEPRQILRSSGNVLTAFLQDENGNGRPDLWLWRVEQVALRDLFLWLAISGSIDIEAFIYHNEGESFARRPGRRITVSLRFPSALSLLGSYRDVREQASNMEAVIPMTRAGTGDGALRDLFVLMDEQLQVFREALEPGEQADEDRFLASLDYRRDRDNYQIDIRRMIDEFEIEINRDLRRMGDREPDTVLTLPTPEQRGDIMARELNGDGREDILVFLQRNNEAVEGMLFLSDPAP